MKKTTNWEDYLRLAYFSYKNGYHTSKMSPSKVLYGRKCRTPVTWDSLVDRLMLGPELLKDLEQLVTKFQLCGNSTQEIEQLHSQNFKSNMQN